jgi:NAD+ synthase
MVALQIDASAQIARLVSFLQQTFARTAKKNAVIAVSGGIDSALSLSLLVKALGKEQVWPILLPYARQDMSDAEALLDFWQIPSVNRKTLNIASMVEAACTALQITDGDRLRKGNVMARLRMIALFDYAKSKDALVVGTENKSEHHLGYFTRFGDEASDVEPLLTLYKTQVRQLVAELQLPAVFLDKVPSAGLWAEQSDEAELGFSYELADQVLVQLVDQKKSPAEIVSASAPEQRSLVEKVLDRVEAMQFKSEVPYSL